MASPDTYAGLRKVDSALRKHAFPALSPFWDETFKRFLRGAQRCLVVRAGRRSGKGLTAAKLACAFAIFGDVSSLAPGEVGIVGFLSVDRDEAAFRLRQVARMLDALEVRYAKRDGELQLQDRPVCIRVLTASTSGVVGKTLLLGICDEVSRWRDAEGTANPASEIVSSLSPALLTMAGSKLLLLSSPWSENDFHAQRFDEGETAWQQVAYAATWQANPSVTEDETRRLEPNPTIWAREYLAIPSAQTSAICSAEEYDRAIVSDVPAWTMGEERIITTDPATKQDAWASAVWRHELRNGPDGVARHVIRQLAIMHHKPRFLRGLKLEEEREYLLALAHEHRVRTIVGDFHLEAANRPWFAERGIDYVCAPQTSAALTARVLSLQSFFAAGTIELLPHDAQRTEVLRAQLVMHAAGRATLRAPASRGAHDDLLSCLLLACDPLVGATKLAPFIANDTVYRRPAGINGHFDANGALHMEEPAGWFRRLSSGEEFQVPPPMHSKDFEPWARGMLAQGISTLTIEQWAAAHGLRVDLPNRNFVPLHGPGQTGINVPIVGG